ncbi:hypothetical protein BY458DRAFT_516532 [Sporodiniella umbellata]|nr:hypothetical protein BY458DRAFT_516532 [Sporodiniella umbellata]
MSQQIPPQKKEVELFLDQCGLSNYLQVFSEEGFDRIESLLEITETDLIQMKVKRGHRRLLQRAVASAKGIPPNIPLNIGTTTINYTIGSETVVTPEDTVSSPPPFLSHTAHSPTQPAPTPHPPTSHSHGSQTSVLLPIAQQSFSSTEQHYQPSAGTMSAQSGMSSTEEETVTGDNVNRLWKRKYHRHPKPDPEAPIKPPSAYVMFSNDTRAELKQHNRSFTDLAKIIGNRWKSITTAEKDTYERSALKARESYLKQTEEYQKTEAYHHYQQYLSDFKSENEAAARPVGRPRKKQALPKHSLSKPTQSQYPFYLLNREDSHQNNSNTHALSSSSIPSPRD